MKWITKLFTKPKQLNIVEDKIDNDVDEHIGLEPGWWIRIGSKWNLKRNGDPFPIPNYYICEVTDIKDGWIRYINSETGMEGRMDITNFLYCYETYTYKE